MATATILGVGPEAHAMGSEAPETTTEKTLVEQAGGSLKVVDPKPLVSVPVGQDHTVEFYELDRGIAFVSETGPAGVKPALNSVDPAVDQDDYVALYRALRPDLKVPRALVALQARKSKASAVVPTHLQTTPVEDGSMISSSAAARTDELCNNGCCYEPWLRSICGPSPNYWDWFYMNATSSWRSGSGLCSFRDVVCAAVGTAAWRGWYCSGGIQNPCMEIYFDLAEGHFRKISDQTCSIWKGVSFYSSVTSSLHTQCGGANGL